VSRVTFPSLIRRRVLVSYAAVISLVLGIPSIRGDSIVTLGDSLTAEYEYLGSDNSNSYPIQGFSVEATDYAKVTDPAGEWESMSWVEVLGRLRGFFFEFGEWRNLRSPWGPPRLSGYERNWAVPGAKASQYEDFMTASLGSNPLFYAFRLTLDSQLRARTRRVVIWLGANDIRSKYGTIYDEDNDAARNSVIDTLKDGLIDDLREIIRHVQDQNSDIEIVVGNLPDLGAAPDIIAGHTNPEKRLRVTLATEEINADIAELVASENVALADIYASTKGLVDGEPFYYGAVQFDPGLDDDNDPHALFSRDGFHPNTALQIEIARVFLKAFNTNYDARIPQITHAEALNLLKINPREPYRDWITNQEAVVPEALRGLLKDPDLDRMPNLMEYAFNTAPAVSDAGNLPFALTGPVPGFTGDRSVTYRSSAVERREIDIAVQYKVGTKWIRVPLDRVIENGDGTFTAAVPPTGNPVTPVRIKVILRPPQGSLNTLATALKIETTAVE